MVVSIRIAIDERCFGFIERSPAKLDAKDISHLVDAKMFANIDMGER